MIWGTPELDVYVNGLVMDSRDGTRKGLPMKIGGELLWLSDVNKHRRAIEYQERYSINLQDAQAKVRMEDDARTGVDLWGDPAAGGVAMRRSPIRAALSFQSRRGVEGKSVLASVGDALTSKFVLMSIIAILVLKDAWLFLKTAF